MNIEAVSSYVIDTTWFFLGSWVVALLAASVAAFRGDRVLAPSRRRAQK
jgi:hypothetical protein